MSDKLALIILDGWGIGKKDNSNGVHLANTPFFDGLLRNHPNATLVTYGEKVGLPKGQMGNSEVGHMNIGAGRIVYQDLLKIDNAIKDESFFKEEALLNAIEYAKAKNKKIHLIGLVSKGGVHSSFNHLTALCDLVEKSNAENCFIHAFTDGRDCNPTTGLTYIKELSNYISKTKIKIASVIGRYYSMDRDNRWERIKKAYDLLVNGIGEEFTSPIHAIENSYFNNVTDEFITPKKISDVNGKIEEGDVVICFNFRTDRCREITIALTQQNFPKFQMKTLPLHYVTMTNYDKTFKGVHVVYDKLNLVATLGEVIGNNKFTQLRIAETEKYPHVTYFFNGGREEPFPNEERIMAHSPKVSTYDLQPEMSALEITEKVCDYMDQKTPNFICLNYANPDMVGHTGVPGAIIKACETVDDCLKKVIEKGSSAGYSFVVIADHGNADIMFNEDGTPHTAHSVNLVPIVVVDDQVNEVENGILADIAPTILQLMGIEKPLEMSGNSLVVI